MMMFGGGGCCGGAVKGVRWWLWRWEGCVVGVTVVVERFGAEVVVGWWWWWVGFGVGGWKRRENLMGGHFGHFAPK